MRYRHTGWKTADLTARLSLPLLPRRGDCGREW
jgi:hypothetical protein